MIMKKLMILFILILLAINIKVNVNASLIDDFQEITFENSKHRHITSYKETELKKHYPKVTKRTFWGWRTYELNKSMPVHFRKTTLLSISNRGTTPIYKEQTTKMEKTQKYAVSGTYGLGATVGGNVKGFKLGLDRKISIKADATITVSQLETETMKITIDPMTVLNYYIEGTGRITNGVGARYIFFVRTHLGGYEYLNITSLYFRMEKKRL